MSWKQASFILGAALFGLLLPVPFSVSMFLMGLSIGGFLVIVLN